MEVLLAPNVLLFTVSSGAVVGTVVVWCRLWILNKATTSCCCCWCCWLLLLLLDLLVLLLWFLFLYLFSLVDSVNTSCTGAQ